MTAAGSIAGPTLHVAVEASRLRAERRGIGRYVRALLPRLLAERAELRLTLYVKARDVRRVAAALRGQAWARGRVAVRPRFALRWARADVLWFPWNVVAPRPWRGTVVPTIHDVTPIVMPDPRPEARKRNARWLERYHGTAAQATLVIVDSAFVAEEVHRLLGVPTERIRVVPLAADDVPLGDGTADGEALDRLGVRAPYLLAVGASEPRKNLALLDRAMPAVAAAHPEVTLVMAGPRSPASAVGDAEGWRRTLGFVSEEELQALYRGATCLVLPSTYEGFGLPVLEAMRLGTPVVCARSSALPELAGEAAQWFDPTDATALSDALATVLADASLRARLRDAGRERAARFTWDETARRTLAAFDDAVRLARD